SSDLYTLSLHDALPICSYLPDREKRAKLCAVFGLLGMVDVPFNYLSIYFFRTQHPQPVVSPGGGGLDPDLAKTFLVSSIAFAFRSEEHTSELQSRENVV